MLDEAHDCSAAQLDVLMHARGARIMVYDASQRIYGFRCAVPLSTLQALPAVARLPLTVTWRYGEPLASAAQQLVRGLGGDAAFTINSAPDLHTRIHLTPTPPFAQTCALGEQLVILVRKNRAAFELTAMAILSGAVQRVYGEPFVCVGGADDLLDACVLARGGSASQMHSRSGLAAHCATSGGGYRLYCFSVDRYGTGTQREIVRIVAHYGAELPHLVGRMQAALVADASDAQVLVYTGHRSKGKGWAHVYVASDFMLGGMTPTRAASVAQRRNMTPLSFLLRKERWEHVFSVLDQSLVDEINLLYVALTRAKHTLYIAPTVCLWLREAGVVI
jgi:hypothetical protein